MSVKMALRMPDVVWSDAWEKIQKRTDEPEIQIPFLPALSKRLYGLQRREMLVIGARTSQGKTAFALQLAYNCARQGLRTHFLSMEMSPEALMERLFCQVTKIPNYDLRKSPDEKVREIAEDFKVSLKGLPLAVSYKIGSTVKDLYTLIKETPVDVVILDYIQAIRALNFDRLAVINDYIVRFRELAITKNMACVLVSQINRGAMDSNDKRPQLWQLKASGTIEEHADSVILLHWDFFYDTAKDARDFDVIIAKNRNGRIGTIKARFESEYYLIGPRDDGSGSPTHPGSIDE